MKRTSLILLAAAIIIGAIASSSYALDKGIGEEFSSLNSTARVETERAVVHAYKEIEIPDFLNTESTLTSLKNLGWLRYLARGKMDNPDRKSIFPHPETDSTAITSKMETTYAVIYGYQGAEIPSYLTANFDRIFKMVANYLNSETKKNKVVIWIMDFDTLQEGYPGQKNYPGGSPDTIAALYAPSFNYFFFTPRYMNDYYLAHELIHHFIDEYQEEVISGLPQIIVQKNASHLPPENFIKQYQEEIASELSQIIIRQNLASFAVQGV